MNLKIKLKVIYYSNTSFIEFSSIPIGNTIFINHSISNLHYFQIDLYLI